MKAMHHEWHTFSSQAALDALGSGLDGLNEKEVSLRQQRFGPNILPRAHPPGLLNVYLRQFASPLIFLLLAAAAVSLAIEEFADALFIFAVLQINALIGTVQEWRAQTSAEKLNSMIQTQTLVTRGGEKSLIPSTELVVGDVIHLLPGSNVPVDIRLLNLDELRVDESHLTGESLPVDKVSDETYPKNTPLADRRNMLHAGSVIDNGRATGVVVLIASNTSIGKIAEALAKTKPAKTPLELRLHRFTWVIGALVMVAVITMGASQFMQGVGLLDIFQVSVALAVSAIPEGLPVAITVALSVGSARMARRNVIVPALHSVEGLGACTLIASDKTGTITCNMLTAKLVVLADGTRVSVGGDGYNAEGDIISATGQPLNAKSIEALRDLVQAGCLSSDASFEKSSVGYTHFGDTTDVAFLVLAAKLGIYRKALLNEMPEVVGVPFDSARKHTLSINSDGERMIVSAKGAAETVLPLCEDGEQAERILNSVSELAASGYRVLALASGEVSQENSQHPSVNNIGELKFLGLVGIIDPLRPEVPQALIDCDNAGIEVRMVTGDHPQTAYAIGHQIGLADGRNNVVLGADLAALGDDQDTFDNIVSDARIFARVDPIQKLMIVRSLVRKGHFVAVTGDGVNDAPALKASHIGVAMGREGTDVARSAANLILADDNFASIVAGIEEGRIAYNNVRKVVYLLVSTGGSEIVLFFLSLFAGLPLPLFAIQLLWLNLVTNGVQDVALAFEKGEPGILRQPPRPPTQPIFDRQMTAQTLVSGLFIGISAFWFYSHQLAMGVDEAQVRNELLLLMVLFENVHVFNCRSERRSAFKVPFAANPMLIWAVIITQLIHIGAMYTPGIRDVLGIAPVSFVDWISVAGLALGVLVVMEIFKVVYGLAGKLISQKLD